MKTPLRLVFMGTPEFAVQPLKALLLNQGYQVVAVYTQPDRQAGRGRQFAASPVKAIVLSMEQTPPVVQPKTLKDAGVIAQLTEFHPDVIVVAAFGQILPPVVLGIPSYGCINVHPSLLPRFRGPSPVAAAILAGDNFTGVSIMLMDQGLDTGPVLAQAQVSIAAYDTNGNLTSKLSQIGARLLPEILPRWVSGEIAPRPQNEAGATYSVRLTKESSEINWGLPAVAIWRQIRAYQPWPGSYTYWRGKRLTVIEAVPVKAEKISGVGTVVALDKGSTPFGVTTGDGVLGIIRLQLEGKRALDAAEFSRGQGQLIGAVLPRV